MQQYNRPETIQVLAANKQKWTSAWVARKNANNSAKFFWPVIEGEPLNRLLCKQLLAASDQHCAYCDSFPMNNSDETIDHFRPKSIFIEDAFKWENLFPVCNSCQSEKREKYDDLLLKPDIEGYSFEHYFIIDFTTFEILPNPSISDNDRDRAQFTILTFGLNQHGHCQSRRHHHQRYYLSNNNMEITDFAYRYMFL
jgi:uncharacterized protein (TIGR02646 family)